MQLASSCEVCSSSEGFHGQDNSGLCSSITSCIKCTPRRKCYILLHLLRKSFPSSLEYIQNVGQPTSYRKHMNHPHLQTLKKKQTQKFSRKDRDSSLSPAPIFCFKLKPTDNSLRQDCTSAWETRATFTTCGTRTEKRLLTEFTC